MIAPSSFTTPILKRTSWHCQGKELQGQQVRKEGLILFPNPHKFPLSHPFWSFGGGGRNRVLGQPLITPWWKMKNLVLLTCAEIWSPPAPAQPLLSPSPSPAHIGLPQPHATLSCAWPLGFGDKNTVMGTPWGINMSQCFSESGEKRIWTYEGSKLYFQKGERKDTGAKEKSYKLFRGYQNGCLAQPKPGP